jgi:hypothetical protein
MNRNAYSRYRAYVGLALFLATLLVLGTDGRRLVVGLTSDHKAWQIVTGAFLLAAILYQSWLFAARETKNAASSRRLGRRHPWVGMLCIALFVLHVGRLGYALTAILVALFGATCALGIAQLILENRVSTATAAVLRAAHLGVSAALLPFIAIHIWSALFFN